MKRILVLLMVAMLMAACGNTNELEETISTQKKEIEDLQQELEESEEYASILESRLDEMEEKEEENEDGHVDNDDDYIEDGKDEKIEMSPGTYIFGEHIEPGRYTITFQDDYSGTIIFHGEEKFGQNFGMRDGYIYDYTFNAQDGEKLETRIPVILFPEQ